MSDAQSTTSTANSGLYDYILPAFKEKTGITVNVVAVGTGQAIKNAQNGDGDVLLVSGPVGDHGIAVLLAREQFGLRGDVRRDARTADPRGVPRLMQATP